MVNMPEYEEMLCHKNKARASSLLIIIGIALVSIFFTKTVPAHVQDSRFSEDGQESSKEEDKELDGFQQENYQQGGGQESFAGSYLIPVPLMNQQDYPTGCESVTSVMALNYAGFEITVDEFIDKYLRIGTFYEKEGQYYGNSPYYYFIGDPRTAGGFGCFAPVIHDALTAVAGRERVKDLTGMTLAMIVDEYIKEGIPVIIWATIDMQPTYDGRGWFILETGKYYTWPAGEHCLLLVGADEEYYYFNDPKQDTEAVRYEKSLTQMRYLEMGSQALALMPTL